MKNINLIQQKLILKRYSPNTINTYLACLNAFFRHFKDSDTTQLNKKDILDYLESLIHKGYSKSSQNQHINAIKFYYEKVLGCPRDFYQINRPRKENRLPEVLSKAEVIRILHYN